MGHRVFTARNVCPILIRSALDQDEVMMACYKTTPSHNVISEPMLAYHPYDPGMYILNFSEEQKHIFTFYLIPPH